MIGRRAGREMRPGRAPGGLRRVLRCFAITGAVVLAATAAVPAVGVVIAGLFWVLLAAALWVAAAAAAGPVRRWAPIVVTAVASALAAASGWASAHRPGWLGAHFAVVSRLGAWLLAMRPRWARRRRRDLVPAIATPRVPLAALPPAEAPRDRDPWRWAA